MTVTTPGNKQFANGDGSTTIFYFQFRLELATDLQVYVNSVEVLPSTYTVGINDTGYGGFVQFNTAPDGGVDNVLILREVDYLQDTHFPNENDFDQVSLEDAVDKLAMGEQQLAEEITRCVLWNVTVPDVPNLQLPAPIQGEVLGWGMVPDPSMPTEFEVGLVNLPNTGAGPPGPTGAQGIPGPTGPAAVPTEIELLSAYGNFQSNGVVIGTAINIQSCAKINTGTYTVTFTNPVTQPYGLSALAVHGHELVANILSFDANSITLEFSSHDGFTDTQFIISVYSNVVEGSIGPTGPTGPPGPSGANNFLGGGIYNGSSSSSGVVGGTLSVVTTGQIRFTYTTSPTTPPKVMATIVGAGATTIISTNTTSTYTDFYTYSVYGGGAGTLLDQAFEFTCWNV